MSGSVTIGGGSVLRHRRGVPDLDLGAPANVVLSGDRIEAITDRASGGGLLVDADGLIVGPGLIDLQINGGFGHDLVNDPSSMWDLARHLPRHGVIGFLPTIITSPSSVRAAAMDALGRRPVDGVGAEPLGLHFEGPMLSKGRPGAHPSRHLVGADLDVIAGWSGQDGVALVTIAPELAGAPRVIAELVRRGVTVSAGHSEATAEQSRAGMDAGITTVTHLFNAMSPLGHRAPNLVGLALARPELTVSLIVDGVHLDPEIVMATWRAKGPGGIVLISDAVAAMGMGPGTHGFGEKVTIADDRAVRTLDGVLAGSILTMDRAVRNLTAWTGCSAAEALAAASTTPARVLGRTDRGRVEAGCIADLALFDRDLHVQATFCRGRLTYVAEGSRSRFPSELLEAS